MGTPPQQEITVAKSRHIARRDLLKAAGAGAASVFLANQRAMTMRAGSSAPVFADIDDVRLRDGDVLLRIEISSDEPDTAVSGCFEAVGGRIARVRRFFFEPREDHLANAAGRWTCRLTKGDFDVFTLRLRDATTRTELVLKLSRGRIVIPLKDVLDKGYVNTRAGAVRVAANFLLDKEIGKIDPQQIGIARTGDDFDFVIFADPQGGDPADKSNEAPQRIAIHNPVVARNVRRVNRLAPKPEFVLVDGDIVDSKGQWSNYAKMLEFLGELQCPVLFELGNHETRYGARFSPGYNHDALANYFRAQKQINGLEKIAYSFDLGKWHFVVWPDPLRCDFWPNHPHYFEWLEDDLRRHRDRPTIFFQHVHLLPLGIDPMITYAEKIPVKRRLLDLITRHGNVRYVFSGHTHIPVKASFKTACTYRGTKFINLPPAGYRPRGFGEPDFDNGLSQGFAVVSVQDEQAHVRFETVDGRTYRYPEEFEHFDPAEWPLWMTERWRLPAEQSLVNADFEQGLAGWHKRFVYMEDEDPCSICRVVDKAGRSGSSALYLYCRPRGARALGQDRMPQTINRLCQAIAIKPDTRPILKARYQLAAKQFHPSAEAGAYIWLEGFSGSSSRLNILYWIGKGFPNPVGLYGSRPDFLHFDITAPPEQWHEVVVNIAGDQDARGDETFASLHLDRLVLTLGVWNENVGKGNEIGVYFDDLELAFDSRAADCSSSVDGKPIPIKPKTQMWNKRIVHVNGEHAYKTIDSS